jgi:hypothetical protein
MGLPAIAQHLGARPPVVWSQFDAEQIAHLSVESARRRLPLRTGDRQRQALSYLQGGSFQRSKSWTARGWSPTGGVLRLMALLSAMSTWRRRSRWRSSKRKLWRLQTEGSSRARWARKERPIRPQVGASLLAESPGLYAPIGARLPKQSSPKASGQMSTPGKVPVVG